VGLKHRKERLTMEELRVKVPDMSCGHCVGAIERALAGVDGVIAVEASLDMKIVTVRADRNLDHSVVITAVEGAGYTPKIER
jgi:copper chaperone